MAAAAEVKSADCDSDVDSTLEKKIIIPKGLASSISGDFRVREYDPVTPSTDYLRQVPSSDLVDMAGTSTDVNAEWEITADENVTLVNLQNKDTNDILLMNSSGVFKAKAGADGARTWWILRDPVGPPATGVHIVENSRHRGLFATIDTVAKTISGTSAGTNIQFQAISVSLSRSVRIQVTGEEDKYLRCVPDKLESIDCKGTAEGENSLFKVYYSKKSPNRVQIENTKTGERMRVNSDGSVTLDGDAKDPLCYFLRSRDDGSAKDVYRLQSEVYSDKYLTIRDEGLCSSSKAESKQFTFDLDLKDTCESVMTLKIAATGDGSGFLSVAAAVPVAGATPVTVDLGGIGPADPLCRWKVTPGVDEVSNVVTVQNVQTGRFLSLEANGLVSASQTAAGAECKFVWQDQGEGVYRLASLAYDGCFVSTLGTSIRCGAVGADFTFEKVVA